MKENNRKKTDADTMCSNTLLSVNQKECVPHSQKLPQWITSTMAMVKHMPHQREFGKNYDKDINWYCYPQIKLSLVRCFLKY